MAEILGKIGNMTKDSDFTPILTDRAECGEQDIANRTVGKVRRGRPKSDICITPDIRI